MWLEYIVVGAHYDHLGWGGPGIDEAMDVGVSAAMGDERFQVAGIFSGTADLDPSLTTQNFISKGGYDISLSGFEGDSTVMWLEAIGGPTDDIVRCVDKSGGNWPNTTISMGATFPTGRSPYLINRNTDLPTGSGLYSVSLGVNMSKSVDPGSLFGSIGCSYPLERDGLSQDMNGLMLEDIKPGMSYSASIGLAYAMTYALSMNVSFNYGYSMTTEYHFSNSDQVMTSEASSSGSLGIGMGYRISPLTTLSFSLSIGLTPNDPDFSFSFRLPLTI